MTWGSGHHGKHCNQELINWIRLSWDRHESWPAVVWIPSVEDNLSRNENVTGLALESSRAHRHEEWHFMINYTTRSSDSISISIAIERANKKPTIMKCWRDKIDSSRVVKQVVYFSLSVALRPHIDVYNFNQYIEFSSMIYMTRDLFLLRISGRGARAQNRRANDCETAIVKSIDLYKRNIYCRSAR